MRGLLMIEPLYHQTVAGLKTMTRRSGGLDAVNGTDDEFYGPQPLPDFWMKISHTTFIGGKNWPDEFNVGYGFCPKHLGLIASIQYPEIICKPRYRVGEVLFLKEPTFLLKWEVNDKPFERLCYKYDNQGWYEQPKWNNKLFMPASAARAYIRITGIKCERLLDISDEDCIAEGLETIITKPDGQTGYKIYGIKAKSYSIQPNESFFSLYKFANKMKFTAEIPNLWVFAYTFEYLKDYKP